MPIPLLTAATLAASASAPTPAMMVHCDPARAAERVTRLLPPTALAARRSGEDPLMNTVATLVLEPTKARQLGLDPDGPFHVSAAPTGTQLSLPLEAAGPGALAQHLGFQVDDDGAVILGGSRVGRVEDRTLTFAFGEPPPLDSVASATPSLQSGCTLQLPLPMGLGHLTGDVPRDPTLPVRLSLERSTPAPAVLERPQAPPIGGSSSVRPFFVASIGVSPHALATDPAIAELLERSGSPTPDGAALRALRQVRAGTTVAVFLTEQDPDVVVVVPTQSPRGNKLPVRRTTRMIKRSARQAGAEVWSVGPTTVRFQGGGRVWTVTVQTDRIIVGTDSEVVLETAQGSGEPWIDDHRAPYLRDNPIALSFDSLPIVAGEPRAVLQAGLRTNGTALQLMFQLEGDPAVLQQLLSSLSDAEAPQRPSVKKLMEAAAQPSQ